MPKDTTILAKIIALDAELSVHLDAEKSTLLAINAESDENLTRLQATETELSSSTSHTSSTAAKAHIKPIDSRIKELSRALNAYNKKLSSLYSKTIKILDTIKTIPEKDSSSLLDTAMAKGAEIIAKIDQQQLFFADINKKISIQHELVNNINVIITQREFPDKLGKIDSSISKIKGQIHDIFRAMAGLPILVRREQTAIDSIRASIEEINAILTHSVTTPMLVRHLSSEAKTDESSGSASATVEDRARVSMP